MGNQGYSTIVVAVSFVSLFMDWNYMDSHQSFGHSPVVHISEQILWIISTPFSVVAFKISTTMSSEPAALWLCNLLIAISISLRSIGGSDLPHYSLWFIIFVLSLSQAISFSQYYCHLLITSGFVEIVTPFSYFVGRCLGLKLRDKAATFLKRNLGSWLVLCWSI